MPESVKRSLVRLVMCLILVGVLCFVTLVGVLMWITIFFLLITWVFVPGILPKLSKQVNEDIGSKAA